MKTIALVAAGAVMATAGFVAAPRNAEAQSGPRGSYSQSCSNAYVNQGRLYATCRDTRGQSRASSIELSPCASSDIGNDNGLLICHNVRGRWENSGGNNGGGNNGGGWGGGNGGNNGGGWGGGNNGGNNGGGWGGNNGGGWGGNSGGSITVYENSNYGGASQSFRNEQPNLPRNMNDAISSIQVQGAWEVCTDAYYRGQCQVIDGNARNLDRWGLNDRISSMRPARRGGGGW